MAILNLLLHSIEAPIEHPVGQRSQISGTRHILAIGGASIPIRVAVDRNDGCLRGQSAGAPVHGQRDDALLLLT